MSREEARLFAKRLSGVLNSERIVLTTNAACSGATTDTVALPPELNDARLVTLTVGAANLGLSDVAAACIGGTLSDCLAAIEPAQRELGECPRGESTLGDDLIDLYGDVAKAARGARIVVTGYPLLFEPPADPNSDLAAKSRQLTKRPLSSTALSSGLSPRRRPPMATNRRGLPSRPERRRSTARIHR
jgi:hypothetical protein